MADPGVSGQNFLDLLFRGPTGRGGAQAGVDQIPQQQAQQADLTLALQRMMQQKQQFDESTAGIDRRFNTEQDRLKANADREFGLSSRRTAVDEAGLAIKMAGLGEPSDAETKIANAGEALKGTLAAIDALPIPEHAKGVLRSNAEGKASLGQAPTINAGNVFTELRSGRVAKSTSESEDAGKRTEFISNLMQRGGPITPKDRVAALNVGIRNLDLIIKKDGDPITAIQSMIGDFTTSERVVQKEIGGALFPDVVKVSKPEQFLQAAEIYVDTHPDLTNEQLMKIRDHIKAINKQLEMTGAR